jgi:PLP dependent protein
VGESYAQELVAKLRALGDTAGASPVPPIQFIGQLQTNKVRVVAEHVAVFASVDRASLATEIAKRRPGARVFVQVRGETDPADGADKGGIALPDAAAFVHRCRDLGLFVEGLLTVGPTSGDPAATADVFRRTRAEVDALGLAECSMGMSGDLELAVRHGATQVRVGTALFGSRR